MPSFVDAAGGESMSNSGVVGITSLQSMLDYVNVPAAGETVPAALEGDNTVACTHLQGEWREEGEKQLAQGRPSIKRSSSPVTYCGGAMVLKMIWVDEWGVRHTDIVVCSRRIY